MAAKNSMDSFSLKGKNAVVLGGAGMLGAAIARGLAAHGSPPMGGVASTPCVWDGKVYVGSTNGYLYCLSAADGHQIWSQPTYDRSSPAQCSKIIASPVVHSSIVYVGNEAANLYAFDAATGNPITGYQPVVLPIDSHGITGLETQNMTGTSSPAVATVNSTDYLLFGCDDGYLYRITLGVPNPQSTLVGVDLTYCVESSPTVAGNQVYVGISHCAGDEVYRLSIQPLQQVGSQALRQECRATPAYGFDHLYVGVDTGWTFHKLVPATLEDAVPPFAAPSITDYFVGSAALAQNRTAYVGNDNGRVYALSATDLSQLTTYTADAGRGFICSGPAVAYNVDVQHNRWVYVVSRAYGGKLLAFKTAR